MNALMSEIRHLAQRSERVFFSDHALERMSLRGVTDLEAIRALRLGEIAGSVWSEPSGERACKVTFRPRGSRTLGVVTIVLDAGNGLFVKTVEWEDGR